MKLCRLKKIVAMTRTMFLLLLPLQFVAVAVSSEPCSDHYKITTSGYRSSDFNSFYSEILICDNDFYEDSWYRFDLDAGTRLMEKVVQPYYCGTQAPIWMNGTHPTDDQEIVRQVCASFTEQNLCGWKGNVTVKLCNDTGEAYYVYKLPIPGGCSLAYCVDAATRRQCQPPQVWLPDEYQCGKNSTPAPSTTRMPTTPYITPSQAPDSSWGPWGPWSGCSKKCDYGLQSRKRSCVKLPCQEGSANEIQLCNDYNCQELEEEKDKGIIIVYNYSPDDETMIEVVENEAKTNEIIRASINKICSANESICCGTTAHGHLPDGIAFVTSDDIYSAQGFPRHHSNNKDVINKVVSVINEYVYKELCQSGSKAVVKRQSERTGETFLAYEIMAAAVKDCQDQIKKETGLEVLLYENPLNYPLDDDAKGDDNESCPTTTCVVPIAIGCILAVVVIILLIVVCYKCMNKSSKVESPPPPYESGAVPVMMVPSKMDGEVPVYYEAVQY